MWPFCVSAVRSGFRSRAILLILVLGVALVGVAYLASSFSPRQPRTVTLDVGFSGIRLSLVLLAVFWVQELIGREVERRTVLYALAYPLSRTEYIVGRYLGIAFLLAVAAAGLGALLWCSVWTSGGEYQQSYGVSLGFPYLISVVGLWLDALVVAAFTVWIASLSTVAMLPVALGAMFAIAGKGFGALLDYLARGADGDTDLSGRFGPIAEAIKFVLPDLSRLDFRTWSMYGVAPPADALWLALGLAVGYVLILISLAALSFSRREFF